jgi:hypothetical protein
MHGYLFKENRLSVPASSLRQLLVCEAHEGALLWGCENLGCIA